jgi:DNA-directed RNA polymerase specialized sigma24 family protein
VALTGGALTSPKPLKFEKKSRDHETIFLNHYAWLLDWARQHTHGNSQEAEDLVQDLYVRFVQMKSGPAFKDDDQVRAYLYTSLKNLFVSKKLRSGRDAVSGLRTVDFDSVDFAISAVDRSQLLHVRSDLAAVCEYACIRRRTSRAASALILRFFLGYLPTEVTALLRAKRSNLDTLIETARLEAKAYLNRPGVLRFLSRSERKSHSFPRYLPEQPEALFTELQRRIFAEPEGACLPANELQDRYLLPDAPPLNTQEIAHLASCRVCLSQASRLLGLPDLLLHMPEGDREGTNPPGAVTGEVGLKKLRRRLRETYEHRPKKLQIAVDGEVRAVQTITSVSSNFQIALPPLSQPSFVEVLSEQGLGLLYFDLQQEKLDVPAPQVAAVDLSDGRSLSVTLSLAAGAPVIDVSYYDPLLEIGDDAPPSAQAPVTVPLERSYGETRLPDTELTAKRSQLSRLSSIFQSRRPWVIAIALGVCLVIVLGLVHTRTPGTRQRATAATILAESAKRERSAVAPHGAIRELFSLEIRSGQGKVIGRAEVDSLRSADRPLQSLRLRTAGGEVLATHWIDTSGKATDAAKRRRPTPEISGYAVDPQDHVWQHPPNAADFEQIAGGNRDLHLRGLQGGYEVIFNQVASSEKGSIVQGHLIIAAGSMRPVAETLRVKEGADTREYEFKELRYDILRPDQVGPNDFIPHSYPDSLQHEESSAGNAHLALQALQILELLPQNLKPAVDLERHPDHGIEITGVLPTRQDATALIGSLRSLRGGAALRLKLHSADEIQIPRRRPTIELDSPVSIPTDRIPLDGLLRESLDIGTELSGGETDQDVRASAREILARSARVHRAAWALSQIGARDFRRDELAAMTPRDKQLWLALLADQLMTCDAALKDIAGILAHEENLTTSPRQNAIFIQNTQQLAAATNSFRQNAGRLDQLLVAGFAVSPEMSSHPVRPDEVLKQLSEIQLEESRLMLTIRRLQRAGAVNPQ